MIYTIIFLSGAVLMSLEMIGSRILAPSFGSSIYVWGSLITVVMAALTLGYYVGGRLADRRPGPAVLSMVLALAGVYIGFLPFWSTPVSRWFSGFDLRIGSLAAAVAFFFIPGVCLAMVSPYGIKLTGKNMSTIGNTAGFLAALSCGGSILGTLATSFYLVAVMGVRNIVHMLGLILLIMAMVVLAAGRQRKQGEGGKGLQRKPDIHLAVIFCITLSAVLLALCWRLFPVDESVHPFNFSETLYNKDSLYHKIIVDQVGRDRHLHFDNSYQSALDLDDPMRMVFQYTSYLHLGIAMVPSPRRVLFIGLGGGSAPRRFLHDYPSIEQIEVVEIDPEVVSVAYRYFQLPRSRRMRVITGDGRLFVRNAAEKIKKGEKEAYDMVVIDAYHSHSIPYHLTTLEFFTDVRRVLSPRGIVVSNVIGALSGPNSKLLRAMTRTFDQVFSQVYLFPVGGWYGKTDWVERNFIVIAGPKKERWTGAAWQKRVDDLFQSGELKEDVRYCVSYLVEEDLQRDGMKGVPLLTDDFAPVDILQSPL